MGGLKADLGNLTGDVRALGGILGRIEQGVSRAQEKSEEREHANKPNLIAVVSVLISIISILIGGAWLVGGSLARLDERSIRRDLEMDRMYNAMDRIDERLWRSEGDHNERQAPPAR